MSAIGNEYGNALFLLAKEDGIIDEVSSALIECSRLFEENPEYLAFLETPSIPLEERLSAIRKAFDGSAPDCVSDFLSILTERGYVRFYPDCAEEFERQFNREFEIAVADVVSARDLGVAERQQLRDKLQTLIGKRIKLRCTVDPDLIGGLVVKIDGRLFDGSLRTRISEIQEEMTK